MATVLGCVGQKYLPAMMDDDMNVYVYISNSPEAKNGYLPPIITLCDLAIQSVGCLNGMSVSKFCYVSELDLTDNLLSSWSEISLILRRFSHLSFLNLSNNLIGNDLDQIFDNGLKRLALNGNKIDWSTTKKLLEMLSNLEELHLSSNDICDPDLELHSESLQRLHLSRNSLSDLEKLSKSLQNCTNLQLLSLAENPIDSVPASCIRLLPNLANLNLSRSQISSFADVEVLRKMQSLCELRLQHCPLLLSLTKHERRMVLVARLPNVKVLNGGTRIEENEREDAERAFIRRHINDQPRPERVEELIKVHGHLEPLVNVDLAPEKSVQVEILFNEEQRKETLDVYMTVAQLKAKAGQWFGLAPQNMRVFYCDQDLVSVAGPEEMKWPQKALYTYNVRSGDHFIVDEKVQLTRLRTSSRTSIGSLSSPGTSPANGSRNYNFGTFSALRIGNNNNNTSKGENRAKRNLFDNNNDDGNNDDNDKKGN